MFFIPGDTQFYVEKPMYLLYIPKVPMDTPFHNSTKKLLVFFLFFFEKSNYFCLETRKISQKMLVNSGMSSDLLLFRLRRHLWEASRLLIDPFRAPPSPLWTL